MNLLKLLATTSSITSLSRVLGFVRDTIIAQTFGAGIASDAFFLAFRIPNFLRRIFTDGILSQVLIPMLVKYRSRETGHSVRMFISCVTGFFIILVSLITISGMLAAPWLIKITAPGFIKVPEKFSLTIKLLRVIFPYVLIISLTTLTGSILNIWNYFLVTSITPILLNVSMIIFTLLFAPMMELPIMALALSVIVGGILQLAYQLFFLRKISLLVTPCFYFRIFIIEKFLKQMAIAIASSSINQISAVINTILTSFLMSGSISWIYYADRLVELPSGVIGISLSTILLPLLSKNLISGNHKRYSYLVDWGLRVCFLLALPSSVVLIILSYPIVLVLFQHGKFSMFDVFMTQKALISYSLGLVGLVLVRILILCFYSHQDTKTPFYISLLTLFVTQLMNLIFLNPFKHVGLPLSISLSNYINVLILYRKLRKKRLFTPQPGWLGFSVRLVVAIISMIATLLLLLANFSSWEQFNFVTQFTLLSALIFAGLAAYLTTLWMLGFRLGNISEVS